MGLPLEPKLQEFRAKVPSDCRRTSLISVAQRAGFSLYVMEAASSIGGYHSSREPPLLSYLSEIGAAREYFRKVL